MKFGKRLATQMEETIPEWRDKFLSYKQLKKRLKMMSAPECFTEAAFESSPTRGTTSVVDVAVDNLKKSSNKEGSPDSNGTEQDSSCTKPDSNGTELENESNVQDEGSENNVKQHIPSEEESEFMTLLDEELEKFNNFFIDKEEEYVIRLQELKDRIENVKDKLQEDPDAYQDELIEIRRDIVTFHGQMVLLFNYSSLNYTGLVKILKKYDKRTGTSLRLPFIQTVLKQPFFTTELLSKLVEECEKNLQSIFPSDVDIPLVTKPNKPAEEGEEMESIYRSTMAALQTIKDLRKGSSTYSALSLPPLNEG